MKTIIYYFSGTGNSLKVARDLAQELGQAEVYPIAKAIKEDREIPHDVVGIVFPVYMFGLPLIVADFLRKIRVKPGAYVFTVATLGGWAGGANPIAQKILAKRGIELAAGFLLVMPGNYTPLYGAISKEKQEKMFSDEKIKIKEIAECVLQQKRITIKGKVFPLNFLINFVYREGIRRVPGSDKGLWASDVCIKCGLCEKVCPVANIRLVEGRPQWLHNCQHCMACLQWCPVEAIQYKKSTYGKKRYRHPEITPQDIAGQR